MRATPDHRRSEATAVHPGAMRRGSADGHRLPPSDILALQRSAGNAAVVALLQRCPGGCACGPAEELGDDTRAGDSVAQRRHAAVQRDKHGNIIRHKGKWGAITESGYLRLWAKEAASKRAQTANTLRKLQEKPGTETDVGAAVLAKLPKALYDTNEFEGSKEARDDAAVTLRPILPDIAPWVAGEIKQWYERQLLQALGRTPGSAELETRPDELVRIRTQPYHQTAYSGRHKFMLRAGQDYGDRTIKDIQGCPAGTAADQCPKNPTATIWFYRGAHANWYYRVSGTADKYDWIVEKTASDVARSTQFAAQLFPLMIQVAGFSLGLSSRLSVMIASEVVQALGEEGLADVRGGKRRDGWEILRDSTLGVFAGHVGNKMFGDPPPLRVGPELEKVIEKAAAKGRKEIAATDAGTVEKALRAGKAKNVDDAGLRGQGFRTEVDIVSEGHPHTWRHKRDGTWCRFSVSRTCESLGPQVDQAVLAHPPAGQVAAPAAWRPGTKSVVPAGPRTKVFKRELAADPALQQELAKVNKMAAGPERLAAERALDTKLAEQHAFNDNYIEQIRHQVMTLRASAKTNPAAAHDLKDLYAAQPEWVLAALKKGGKGSTAARRDTVLADAILDKKAATAAKKLEADEYRPPHEADVRIVDSTNGRMIDQDHFVSGGVKDADLAEYGFREANSLTHTEAKAVLHMPLKRGQTMYIVGKYNPCQRCMSRMREAAHRTGGTIVYAWPGGPAGGMKFGGKWGAHIKKRK